MHIFPALPYAFDALEPYIDTRTMQLHRENHHRTAVDNLNKAIAGSDAEHKTLEELLANISAYPAAIRNSAGSHYNHSQFWTMLGPAGTNPSGHLFNAINDTFGSLKNLKEKMNLAANTRFGSGWVWLITKEDVLTISTTPNQDNPLMDTTEVRGIPILGIDIWEHAYYLKYQNHRSEYMINIWNIINWTELEKRYKASVASLPIQV